MAHFPDLAPCSYFPLESAGKLLAVGWLESGHEYTRGEIDPAVMATLTRLLVAPWEPAVFMGAHDCSFCRFSCGPREFSFNGESVTLGIANLLVPGEGVVYVAPSLILHYIDAHEYAPPPEFCEAVLKCPTMRSMEYLKAILANGPPGIARRD